MPDPVLHHHKAALDDDHPVRIDPSKKDRTSKAGRVLCADCGKVVLARWNGKRLEVEQ